MCKCINIDFGDYSNMEIIEFEGKRIQVDKCLVEEIRYLLSQGVVTVASCCGHNKLEGAIAVEMASIKKMEELGYERYHNPYYPDAKEFFKPKSI
ncbi:hypothetical protein [Clostridium baratii]|uniref:hypothetical protein n=1 Tax=Clostridium baratii TaxID=1561 RepID=UPI0030D51EEC